MPRDTVFSTRSEDLKTGVPWIDLLDRVEGTDVVRGQRGLGVHWSRGAGIIQLGPVALGHDGQDVEVPGHWVDLDWSQTNRLIRFLKHARDQAFGRPE